MNVLVAFHKVNNENMPRQRCIYTYMGIISVGKPTVPTYTRTSFSDVFCLLDLLSGVEQQSA